MVVKLVFQIPFYHASEQLSISFNKSSYIQTLIWITIKLKINIKRRKLNQDQTGIKSLLHHIVSLWLHVCNQLILEILNCLRWSTCCLRFFSWLFDHLIYFNLSNSQNETYFHTIDDFCHFEWNWLAFVIFLILR